MRLITPKFSVQQVALILLALLISVLLRPEKIHAQRNSAPAVAQVGPGSPLPVFVVNDLPPALPDGFKPGTSWKFTSWTVPSTVTFTATVQKTEGGWAFLTLSTDAQTTSRWYYIPQMPGAWEQQLGQ
jgi:hypothetical protein